MRIIVDVIGTALFLASWGYAVWCSHEYLMGAWTMRVPKHVLDETRSYHRRALVAGALGFLIGWALFAGRAA